MELTRYQQLALQTAVYPNQDTRDGLIYTVLALCGEAGELANKLKKHIRARTEVNEEVLAYELGDVLWYVAATANELGYELNSVALHNLVKLEERHKQNKLVG